MADRLSQVFATVQERYLRRSDFAGEEAAAAQVDRLREIKRRTLEELRTSGADPDWLDERAEELVITREIVGRLPPRLVHEVRNSWAYLEAEITDLVDTSVPHDELSTLHWYDRAAEAKVDLPAPVGNPADYEGAIEDVALPPTVRWTDADQKTALEYAIGIFGVEPGQWVELDWPPAAHLWDPGRVYQTDFEPCEAHVDEESEGCAACDESVQQLTERNAQWKWTTTLRINEIAFDRDGKEYSTEIYSDQAFEVATTEQDPREIVIGTPGQGKQW